MSATLNIATFVLQICLEDLWKENSYPIQWVSSWKKVQFGFIQLYMDTPVACAQSCQSECHILDMTYEDEKLQCVVNTAVIQVNPQIQISTQDA